MRNINQNILNACQQFSLTVDCLASGPETAEIAIVGDYPGETEARTKLPFSGETGRYLWTLLKPLGLDRTNVYTTNMIKHVWGEGANIPHSDWVLYKEVLEIELGSLPNLKYILALGRNALQALSVPKGDISSWRGSVLEWRQIKVLHTYNPTYIIQKNRISQELEDPTREVIFKLDINKFKRLIAGQYSPDRIETNVCRSISAVRECLEELEGKTTTNPLCIDIEHLRKQTSCIGFCVGEGVGHVIPFFTETDNIFTLEDELWIKNKVSSLIRKPSTRIIGQYVSTDLCWLWFKDGIGPIKRVWGDTLLAHHALSPTLPHSLGFLVSQYTWNSFYKDEGTEWKTSGNIEQYWDYNAKDTVNTYNIHKILLGQLDKVGLLQFYQNHIMRLTHHLCNATVTGIPIDEIMRQQLEVQYTNELQTQVTELRALIADYIPEEEREFNTASPKQIGEILYTHLNAPMLSRATATGRKPVDRETLKKLYESRVTSPIVKDFCSGLIEIRKSAKFLSTYAKVKLDEDNRFRTHYTQTGVRTAPGRLSSTATQWGTGSNIQNQPEKSRAMFIAPEGYCFVYIDGSQAEAHYVGWRARIISWIEDFEKARLNPGSFDCHRALASVIFNTPYDEVPTKDFIDGKPTIRYLGKRARHGLNYRMAPQEFSVAAGIPLHMAVYIYNEYHRMTPELKKWWAELEAIVRKTKRELGYGLLSNPFGRRLTIPERLTTSALDSIVAFEPQSTIGDLFEETWYKSHEDDDWPIDAKILINVHDSLTALCKIPQHKTVVKLLIKHAERPIVIHNDLPPLIIPAEAKVSVPDEHGVHRWSNLKGITL